MTRNALPAEQIMPLQAIHGSPCGKLPPYDRRLVSLPKRWAIMIRGILNTFIDPRIRREWRWLTLRKIGSVLLPSYRFQRPYFSWWNDSEFNSYLSLFPGISDDADRRWTLSQLLKLVERIPGDTAECGVWHGSSSYLICRTLADRRHFMFDSFEGNSEPSSIDGNYHSKGDYSSNSLLDKVKKTMSAFPNSSILPGWIPERFSEVSDRRFCFVHIDVQLYQPTRDSIEFFYPRLESGGLMLFDDYGFTAQPGATKAVDDYMRERPEKVIVTSSGSAFIIKQ